MYHPILGGTIRPPRKPRPYAQTMQIQKYRKKAKLTQQELADRVGVELVTVKKWESEGAPDTKRTPRVEKLKEIAKVLGCTVNDLL